MDKIKVKREATMSGVMKELMPQMEQTRKLTLYQINAIREAQNKRAQYQIESPMQINFLKEN